MTEWFKLELAVGWPFEPSRDDPGWRKVLDVYCGGKTPIRATVDSIKKYPPHHKQLGREIVIAYRLCPALLSILQDLEYIRDRKMDYEYCPMCGEHPPGHDYDCELACLLAKAEELLQTLVAAGKEKKT